MTRETRGIAIVGIGCIFPDSPDPDRFWQLIQKGEDCARRVPEGRWHVDPQAVFEAKKPALDKVYSLRGCFVDEKGLALDERALALPAGLLEKLDPLFKLGLHAAQAAYKDAGSAVSNPETAGVIIGNIVLPTQTTSALTREILGSLFEQKVTGAIPKAVQTDPLNGFAAGLPAGLIARALGFGGLSYTLDAACASSLYALKLAADELRNHRADTMITGGLSRPDCLYTQMGFAQLRALSESGVPAPFDERANGLVVGEGAGMFVLKRLEDALAGGFHIYGVIRGIGLSNDRDGSLLAPSSEGQLRAMRGAYAQAGWQPDQVDLIECHATGTPLGDEVEFNSLCRLWGAGPFQRNGVLGSVKSNVGHLLTAAGSAALMKVLLAFKHRTLPPTANFERPASRIPLHESPFRILSRPEPWPDGERPPRAAVSAFGFGGINAHVLIEAWPDEVPKSSDLSGNHRPEKAEPIAVVGMEAAFGPWKELGSFTNRVLGFAEGQADPPERCWGLGGSFMAPVSAKGYYFGDIRLPLGRFRIPPKELAEMLPQQLLMLLTAFRAVTDAGLQDSDFLHTGVFIGIGLDPNTANFQLRWDLESRARGWAESLGVNPESSDFDEWVSRLKQAAGPALNANRTIGALGGMVAGRISRELRAGGPSFTLSSEETSGLSALHAALNALRSGDVKTAVVGAVDLAGDPRNMFSHSSYRPFKQADSTVGEGAAALVLKPLSHARRDGDRIYALINGLGAAGAAGLNLDPTDSTALREAAARAYAGAQEQAGFETGTVGFLETEAVCPPDRKPSAGEAPHIRDGGRRPLVSSAKDQIGRTGAVSSLASLVKACCALFWQVLPPLDVLPQTEDVVADGPAPAPRKPRAWLHNALAAPRRAGVFSSAVGGSCFHALLEEVPAAKTIRQTEVLPSFSDFLFFVEGNDLFEMSSALTALAAGVAEENRFKRLAQGSCRPPALEKALALALISRSGEELKRQIAVVQEAFQTCPRDPLQFRPFLELFKGGRLFFQPKPMGNKGKIAFVFPGSGNHFTGMGRELALLWPHVFRRQQELSGTLCDQLNPDLFWNDRAEVTLEDKHAALLSAQVALGVAVSDLAEQFAIHPAGVIGYSLGETAGFFATGAWRDRDEMFRRTKDSTLFARDLAGPCLALKQVWGMAEDERPEWVVGVVNRAADRVRAVLTNFPRVYLLIINTPGECVIGGDAAQMKEVVAGLEARFFPLRGVVTVHCEAAKPVAESYLRHHLFETTPRQGVRYYSGAKGRAYEVDRESAAAAILEQALQGVDFPKTIAAAYEDGFRIFLEMGPGASCSRMIKSILKGKLHYAESLCADGSSNYQRILRVLARLIVERQTVNLGLLPYGSPRTETHQNATLRIPVGGESFKVPAPPKTPSPVLVSSSPPIKKTVSPPNQGGLSLEKRGAPAMSITPDRSPLLSGEKTIRAESPPPPTHQPTGNEVLRGALQAKAEAHEAFLRFSRRSASQMSACVGFQMELLARSGGALDDERHGSRPPDSEPGAAAPGAAAPDMVPPSTLPSERPSLSTPPAIATTISAAAPENPFMNRKQCLAFAVGSIAEVLGDRFEAVDQFPRRVRLPDEPLMLVDRILEVGGEPMSHGFVVTEHDILEGSWYLDGGRIPTCIAVEAGQADLFLSAWLGIDFETRGLAVYRLLDAVVTFHAPLPGPGKTIRYHIQIDRFFRQGRTYLFRFSFEGSVDGRPLLTMKDGCAGFFSSEELEAGKGIVLTRLEREAMPGKRPDDWEEWVPMKVESYSEEQVNALRRGDLAACFGPAFADLPLNRPMGIPGDGMSLVHRVAHLDPRGGRFGLGFIRAEADIHPRDWFLVCHFVDDRVMPGTLMYECCLHSLRIFLLRMGWVAEQGEVSCHPIAGLGGRLKCRGQVLETTKKVTYEVTIKELGYGPEPFAIVDAIMYSDQKPIVLITQMSLRMEGLSRARLQEIWAGKSKFQDDESTERIKTKEILGQSETLQPRQALFERRHILAFSVGNPSEAFGEPYRIFDRNRVIARLPGPPFMFLDRIVEVRAEPWKMVAGGRIVAEYDVPAHAWYFAADRQDHMSFAVLLEIALQPCGWFAAYMGSALTSNQDLSFRNLGGEAVQLRQLSTQTGTLRIAVEVTGVSSSGGMIIQHYDYEVSDREGTVYHGNTYFGFFSKPALAKQVGFGDVKLYEPGEDSAPGRSFPFPDRAPFPTSRLAMIDQIECFLPEGGPNGLGFICGRKRVDADDWFFKAHFYQDPVVPGSLGLESFLQLLKVVADFHWPFRAETRFESMALDQKHRWAYRGQVIPKNQWVSVRAVITRIDHQSRTIRAEGYLTVDGLIIYEMKDFAIRAI